MRNWNCNLFKFTVDNGNGLSRLRAGVGMGGGTKNTLARLITCPLTPKSEFLYRGEKLHVNGEQVERLYYPNLVASDMFLFVNCRNWWKQWKYIVSVDVFTTQRREKMEACWSECRTEGYNKFGSVLVYYKCIGLIQILQFSCSVVLMRIRTVLRVRRWRGRYACADLPWRLWVRSGSAQLTAGSVGPTMLVSLAQSSITCSHYALQHCTNIHSRF